MTTPTTPTPPPTRPKRPTPPGTWPVIVAGGLLLIVTPMTIALMAFPRWLAIAVAVIFAAAAVWALATSFVLLWRSWGSKNNGVPIIGCILGAILVTVVLAVTVPYGFAA